MNLCDMGYVIDCVCVCVCVWQIAHMSRTEMTMLDTALIGPGLLFLNQYFDTFFNELVVLWICFVSLSVF